MVFDIGFIRSSILSIHHLLKSVIRSLSRVMNMVDNKESYLILKIYHFYKMLFVEKCRCSLRIKNILVDNIYIKSLTLSCIEPCILPQNALNCDCNGK